MTHKQAVATALGMLAPVFRFEVTEMAAEAYRIGLEGLSYDEIGNAAARAIRECKFMPVPAEMRALVGRTETRDLKHEGEIAWAAVRSAVDEIDYMASEVDFGPHVNACIRQLGGWDVLLRALLEDLNVWKRKEFLRLYEVFAEKPIGDVGRPLDGPEDGRAYKPRQIAIAGIPSQPQPQLEPIGAEASGVRQLIGELARGTELK